METDDVNFGDIIQQSEQLSSQIASSTELPRVHRNLRQIIEAGQALLGRTLQDVSHPTAEAKAAVFLGSKGIDVSRFAEKLDPFFMSRTRVEPLESAGEVDIETYLKNERKNIQLALINKSSQQILQQLEDGIWDSLENDWKKEREEIARSVAGSFKARDFTAKTSRFEQSCSEAPILNKTEVTYGHEIDAYNKKVIGGMARPNLLERFQVAARSLDDKTAEELWDCINSMVANLPYESTSSVIEKRSSAKFTKTMLARARRYLEKNFFKKLQQDVWSNLDKSLLGGLPAIIPLIKAYVAMKTANGLVTLEEGPGDSGPVWAIVYYCVRCGRLNDAINFLKETVGTNEFVEFLEEYVANDCEGLSKDQEDKIRLEYRRVIKHNCHDVYKKILYGILGACDVENDHGEVITRLDDYLWLQLSKIRQDATNRFNSDFLTYSGFQTIISEKYGESHFEAFKQPLVYFQALVLTGQFEAAVEFLTRVNAMKVHGIHVAVALNEMNLLLVSDQKSPLLCQCEGDPPGFKRLNVFLLINRFVKIVQSGAPRDALNYMFFLRNLKDNDGVSLFHICINELVSETRDFSSLFGYISVDGCKTVGLLDNMGVNTQPIIEYCASESESNGLLEDAVALYDLADRPDEALQILIRLIATHCSKKAGCSSPRDRVECLAKAMAERYHSSMPRINNKTLLSTFFIMVDLLTFFNEYFGKRYDNAILILERMRLIPFLKDDIERCVANFRTYCDEIRSNIPDVVLAAMESLLAKFKKLKAGKATSYIPTEGSHPDIQQLVEVKEKVKAITTYCGMIPYFMTGEMYSKLLEIEVQVS